MVKWYLVREVEGKIEIDKYETMEELLHVVHYSFDVGEILYAYNSTGSFEASGDDLWEIMLYMHFWG